MRVDSELLQKYHAGLCTPEEEKTVESWLASGEYLESLDLTETEKTAHKEHMWQQIIGATKHTQVKVIPLYKKIIQYAAAACFIIAVFFAGRISTFDSTPIVSKTSQNEQANFLVYGGNGAYAKIPGDEFNVQFDGQLKLFNGSTSDKTIIVGTTSYTLEPQQTYILMGNKQESSLIANIDFGVERGLYHDLKGDFSIKVLRS